MNDINKLYEKFTNLQKQIKIEDLEDDVFYDTKLKITEITMELKDFFKIEIKALIVEMLKLFYMKVGILK